MNAVKNMAVVFRTDASLAIGTGHVMRCLTLADALRARGGRCLFLCREHEGHLGRLIEQRGHELRFLPATEVYGAADDAEALAHAHWLGCDWRTDAEQSRLLLETARLDWLVVDHYALDARWESVVRQGLPDMRLLVIDDLADRAHVCDVLLDQNFGREPGDYDGLLPASCSRLIGPQYALLRPQFAEWRDWSLERRQGIRSVKRLLVSLGGVDRDNVTGRVLDALSGTSLPEDMMITVVMGGQAPHLAAVRAQAGNLPWPVEVRVDIDDMAALMASSDFAVGAAGSTAWERCCLGLPTSMVVLADNQRGSARALYDAGAAVLLGDPEGLADRLCPAIEALIGADGVALPQMVGRGAAVTDGLGTYRIVDLMQPRPEVPLL